MILEAIDLLILATTQAETREDQSNVLDLLEVFREYTQKGKLPTVSKIIINQISNLEYATKKIEARAKAMVLLLSTTTFILRINLNSNTITNLSNNSKNPSFKSISYIVALTISQKWTLIGKEKPINTSLAYKKKDFSKKRLILVKDPNIQIYHSAISNRNRINQAFKQAGITGPVVASVIKTLNQNTIIITTEAFSAQFLLEKKSIWNHLFHYTKILEDHP